MPAEMGYTGGGMTSFTLKAGGNQLHASGWEYLRNNAVDAKGHFPVPFHPCARMNLAVRPAAESFEDKLFFFGWYDGLRYIAGSSSQLQTVPTAQMLQGDFSNFTVARDWGRPHLRSRHHNWPVAAALSSRETSFLASDLTK